MITIGIVGAGGDGVVSIGEILMKAAAREGYYGRMSMVYDAVIKGGGSAVLLALDSKKDVAAFSDLDILVCFNWEQYETFASDFKISAKTFVLSEKEIPDYVAASAGNLLELVDFGEIAAKEIGEKKVKNILVAGLLAEILGLSETSAKSVIRAKFGKKPEVLAKNLAAFARGGKIDLFRNGQKVDFNLKLPKITGPKPKIIITGNEAIALGAIRAGCGVYAGYPITPASEILKSMLVRLPELKGEAIQTEDEISALAVVLGASFAGVKAMTATSGPGFSLMAEMLGLGIQCEIPAVIVNVQRGGPCTGMPTKSEQSDLNHAVFGGHGDGPRVVIAPYDVKSCYRLAIEAFNISEYYQTPVIVLSDQILGQTVLATDDFTKEEFEIVERLKPAEEELKDYKRYLLTESGISPMAIPGTPGGVYQTRGLTHTEKGRPASASYEWQKKSHEKLSKKLRPLGEKSEAVKIFGDESTKIGIISWGSSAEAALAAREELKKIGYGAKVCVPELLSPFPEKSVKDFLESVDFLLVLEMNFSGQFFNLLKIHCHRSLPAKTILFAQPGGKMFDMKEIAAEIKKNMDEKSEFRTPWYNP